MRFFSMHPRKCADLDCWFFPTNPQYSQTNLFDANANFTEESLNTNSPVNTNDIATPQFDPGIVNQVIPGVEATPEVKPDPNYFKITSLTLGCLDDYGYEIVGDPESNPILTTRTSSVSTYPVKCGGSPVFSQSRSINIPQ